MRAKILAILLLSLGALGAQAQEHPNVAKGLGATMGSGTDLDTINPFNGNLTLRLPIGQSYPVNAGLGYQLALTYNSQVWEHETYDDTTRVIPARGNNAGLGWAIHLGRLNPPQLEFGSSPTPDYYRNTYLAPDGSTHTFYPTLHEGEAATAGVEYTRDGTYLRLKTATRQIEFPDGSVHTFNSLTNGYLTWIEDRYGNFVQVDYQDCPSTCVAVNPANAHRWQITDTQGRVHRIDLRDTGQQGQPLVITQVDLQAFGGARAVWKLIYNDSTDDQSNTGSPVALTGCRGTDNYSTWFLTKVVRPDGSTYQIPLAGYFASNIPGDSTTPCKTGLIKQLRLPTLGQIEWDYMLYKFPSVSTTRNIWQKSTGVGTRRLLNAASTSIGQWTYATVLSGGTTAHEKLLTNSVTDPLGNKVSRYFSVCVDNCTDTADGPYEYGMAVARDSGGDGTGRYLSNQVFDSVGTLLRTTYARFEHDAPSTSTTVTERSRLNQRLASQRLKFDDDTAGTYADETYSDFDGLGHYRHKDSNGNFPGNNVRSNHAHYNPSVGTYGQVGYAPWPAGSPWVINTYSFAWDQESGKIQYRIPCYEAGTGFLQRLRILKNSGSTEHANDVLQVFQRNTAGNVITESHYGGDTQSLSANACGLTLPASAVYQFTHTYSGGVRNKTSVTVGTALNLLDLTIDASTGLPSASRDAAGKQTGFSYDTLSRMTTIDPTDDLLTVASYCTATSVPACPAGVRAQVVAARKATLGGAEVAAVRSRFDDWGRLTSDEVRMPPAGNFAARNYSYNALGWRTFASEQGSAPGTSYMNFDAFGRPRTVRPPDGASHDVTLAYEGVRKVTQTVKVATTLAGESNAVTIELYDRFGRLYEVTEPNNVRTRHDYDVGNRLVKVCQGATGTGTATCGQQRLFNYDLRGFLLSEQHPEKGASGNGTVSYFDYDARGHALRVLDGTSDLTFTYDKAERLTNVRETGGAMRTLKTYTYATANFTDTAGTDYRKGKVTAASRFNYVGAPFNATAEVRDTFAYRAQEGRASEQTRQLFVNAVAEEKFSTTYDYDGFGNFASIAYPDCVFGDCTASDTARTVTFGYSYGRLTSVPGYTGTAGGVSSITYHDNGMVHQVPHSNGVLFTQQNDPNGIARPAGMTAANGTTTLWTAGTHAYDGAGNLKAIGTQTFVYDSLSRISQGTVGGSTQSYTYDNYGNVLSVTTDGVLLNTPTSSSTNRLTAGTYDSGGNLTSWNGNSYQYDAFNQMVRFTSGTEDWIYVYGPDDERFWSYKADGTGSIWALRDLDGAVLRLYNAHLGWTNYEDYIYRDDKLLANYLSGGQRRHFDVDHLGSVRLVTNLSGNQVGFHRYYPFGREHTALQEGDRMKFTGHERDLASLAGDGDDLDYMHARHFSPLTGRFLSTDPIEGIPYMPQSWNRYQYVMGRTMTFTDPQGLFFTGRVFPPVGMTVYDIGYGDTITVTTTAWNGTTTNPFTGVWGLGSLMSGSSFFHSLGLGDLFLLDRNDFSLNRAASLSGQGLGAYVDGLIPFVNPLAAADVYNPDEVGMASMEVVGEAVATVAGTGGAASKAHKAFKAGREIKIGKNLRIAPWGNRTGHKYGRYPHYHRRGRPGPDGNPPPGQGIGRHRPWEPPAPGQPWRTRF